MDKANIYSDFINEIIGICRKYNLSLSHEDSQGGFLIEEYKEHNINWLKGALSLHKFRKGEK